MNPDPSGGPIRPILIQLLLMLLSAWFAAAEEALLNLNESKLRNDAEEGDSRASRLLRVLEQPKGFLPTAQVVITLLGFAAAAISAVKYPPLLSAQLIACGLSAGLAAPLSMGLSVGLLAMVMLILSIMLPRKLA